MPPPIPDPSDTARWLALMDDPEQFHAARGALGDAVRVDLRGVDLHGRDLSQLDLVGCDLRGADLRGLVLRGLYTSRLDGARAEGLVVRFDKLLCVQAQLLMLGPAESWNEWQALNQISLMTLVDLTGVVFDGHDLSEISFTRCNLSGADFRRARLKTTNLTNCDLQGADFSNNLVRWCDLSDSQLAGAKLDGATLELCGFSRTTAPGLSLAGARIKGSLFLQASLPRSRWDGAVVAESPMWGSDFAGSSWLGAMLSDCDLSGSDFTGALLQQHAGLQRCNLEGARLGREAEPPPAPAPLFESRQAGTPSLLRAAAEADADLGAWCESGKGVEEPSLAWLGRFLAAHPKRGGEVANLLLALGRQGGARGKAVATALAQGKWPGMLEVAQYLAATLPPGAATTSLQDAMAGLKASANSAPRPRACVVTGPEPAALWLADEASVLAAARESLELGVARLGGTHALDWLADEAERLKWVAAALPSVLGALLEGSPGERRGALLLAGQLPPRGKLAPLWRGLLASAPGWLDEPLTPGGSPVRVEVERLARAT